MNLLQFFHPEMSFCHLLYNSSCFFLWDKDLFFPCIESQRTPKHVILNHTGFSVEGQKCIFKVFLLLCSTVERNPNGLKARVFPFCVNYAIKPGVYLVFSACCYVSCRV